SVSVTGISWVASDIAPVGHMAVGTLEAVPVTADTWAGVATATRFQHCQVTRFITQTPKGARVSHVTLENDQHQNKVESPAQAVPPEGVDITEFIVAINLAEHPPKTHLGGLFQWQIQEELL